MVSLIIPNFNSSSDSFYKSLNANSVPSSQKHQIDLSFQNEGLTPIETIRDVFYNFLHYSFPLNFESFNTMLASENVLKKEWDSLEEDKAWADL